MTSRRRLLLMGSLGSALGWRISAQSPDAPILGASQQMRHLGQRLKAHLGDETSQDLRQQFALRYHRLRDGQHLSEESALRLMQQEDAANGAWVEVDGVRLSATQLGIILTSSS